MRLCVFCILNVMNFTLFPPINFVQSVMCVISVMHFIRVMRPTTFHLIIIVLIVMRVMLVLHVTRVMRSWSFDHHCSESYAYYAYFTRYEGHLFSFNDLWAEC